MNVNEGKEIDEATKIMMMFIKALPDDLEKGESRIIECPVCKTNTLYVGRAPVNGHTHMNCKKCNFGLMS